MLLNLFYLLLGAVLATPLLLFARQRSAVFQQQLFTRCLLIAALMYVAFALIWGDNQWVVYEIIGVVIYGLFVRFSQSISGYLLALGWLLHPLWDAGLHLSGPGAAIAPQWYVYACISFDIVVGLFIVYQCKQTAS